MKLQRPIIFFDLETTGVDVIIDKVIQIATLKIFPNGDIEEKDYLINPTIPIPKEASEVHGIYDEDVKDKPTFEKYAKNLFKYFEGCDIGGYNSNQFDIPLLIEEFNRCKLELDLTDINFLDVMKIESELNPRTLEAVYKRYTGNDLTDAHDALADVRGTYEVFKKQVEQLNLTSLKEVDKFSQGENERVDVAGKLCNIEGEICWTFGKNKSRPVKNDISYAMWYLRQSVPSETAKIIKTLI